MPNRVPMFRRAAAFAFCGVLALSACGGEEAAKPKPLPTIPGVSDSGGAAVGQPSDGGGDGHDGDATAAPVIPAPDPADYPRMDENTPEGAEQAFRYFIAHMNYAFETNDSSMLVQLSADDCEGCNSILEIVERNNGWGGRWSRADLEEVRLSQLEPLSHAYEIEMLYTLSAHTEPTGPGGETESLGVTQYVATGGLDWDSGRWRVHAVELEWGPDAHSS